MPTRIRIQNFQSIQDADITVQGFTALAGPNNAGKSAVARAIRGVFLNVPAEPMVRSGTDSMRVEVDFGDGQVAWGRDGDRPYYEVGGAQVRPGRDIPPEVQALGIRPVEVGSDKCWPNFARQFDPPFLIEKSGAALAEAVSDPERVALLSQAVRCLDQDLRGLRASILAQDAEVDRYKGELAKHEDRVRRTEGVADLQKSLREMLQKAAHARRAHEAAQKLRAAEKRVAEATKLATIAPPQCGEVRKLLAHQDKAQAVAAKLYRAEINARHAAGVANLPVPSRSTLTDLLKKREVLLGARERLVRARASLSAAEGAANQAETAHREMHEARAKLLEDSPSCLLCQRPL